MATPDGVRRQPRTLLERLIRERRQTFEEFAEYAETFARDHNEPGTLSVRHLQRLVAGRQPTDTLRPATARLLERIFGFSIGELLASPISESGSSTTLTLAPNNVHPLRVAIAVVVNRSEVLIVCRRTESGAGLAWQFPAGMIKPGVRPETVAVNETLAETGVHCTVRRNLGTRVHPVTRVLCNYMLCEYLTGKARNADAVENVSVGWVHYEQLARFIPSDQVFPPVLQALNAQLDL